VLFLNNLLPFFLGCGFLLVLKLFDHLSVLYFLTLNVKLLNFAIFADLCGLPWDGRFDVVIIIIIIIFHACFLGGKSLVVENGLALLLLLVYQFHLGLVDDHLLVVDFGLFHVNFTLEFP